MSKGFCTQCGRLLKSRDEECPSCRGDKELSCPECRCDIDADDLRCAYCGVLFFADAIEREAEERNNRIERQKEDELVCIKRSLSRIEAEFVSGLLESFGIWSLVKADDCAGMRPHILYLVPAQVFVRHADSEQAQQILQEA